jgi:hypothetical protein
MYLSRGRFSASLRIPYKSLQRRAAQGIRDVRSWLATNAEPTLESVLAPQRSAAPACDPKRTSSPALCGWSLGITRRAGVSAATRSELRV